MVNGLSGGITRFSQQFFRFFVTFFPGSSQTIPAESILRHQYMVEVTIGGHVALRFHFINNDIAVHTQFQCGTHTHVIKWRFLVVNFVIVSAQVWLNVNFVRISFFSFWNNSIGMLL